MLQLGKETAVEALGRTWTFGRLELHVLESFRDWVAEQVGDPFATAERFLGRIPAEESMRQIKEAEGVQQQLRGFSLACPLAMEFLKTERGAAKLAHLMLRLHHPDVTESEALAVFLEAGAAVLAEAAERGTGEMPKNEPAPAAPCRPGAGGRSRGPRSGRG